MASWDKLATVTASVKCSGGVGVDGLEVGFTTCIASMKCLPLDPVDPDVAQGIEGLSFRELLQTSVDASQTLADGDIPITDIEEGYILVVDTVEYPIKAVSDWYWRPKDTTFLMLLIEDQK